MPFTGRGVSYNRIAQLREGSLASHLFKYSVKWVVCASKNGIRFIRICNF